MWLLIPTLIVNKYRDESGAKDTRRDRFYGLSTTYRYIYRFINLSTFIKYPCFASRELKHFAKCVNQKVDWRIFCQRFMNCKNLEDEGIDIREFTC